MKPLLIGLLGRAGSGKSTAARHLRDAYGARVFSLADPLKDLAKVLWEFSEEQVRGTQEQKEVVDARWGMSPREAMIRLGDGARNVLGERVWLDACLNKIATHSRLVDPPFIAVIDDVRYPNEVHAVATDERFDGRVVKLVCEGAQSSFSGALSERSVDAVDSGICSTIVSHRTPGSLHLKGEVDAFMGALRLQRSGGG